MSDLHLEFWDKDGRTEAQTDADVLVLAGDVVNLRHRDLRWTRERLAEFTCRYKHVVFVPGNHEFYGTSIEAGLTALHKMEAVVPGLHVLRSGRVTEIEGQRFIGDTMWQPGCTDAFEISDHQQISDMRTEAPLQFRKFEAFLAAELRGGDIVVTHHAPSTLSISERWIGNPCNRWFVTPEVQPLIVERQPRLWIHGHMHDPFDYQIGKTRVLCNPRGYPGERVGFNGSLVV